MNHRQRVPCLSAQVEFDDLRPASRREEIFHRLARRFTDRFTERSIFFEPEQDLESLLLGVENKTVAAVVDYFDVTPAVVTNDG